MKTKTFTVKTDGFAGMLYEPDDESQYAVLMVFGGATGMKMGALFAPRFVNNGIAALVISLFGMEGLPENVDRLEADMIEKAVLYLRDFRRIPHLSIYGQSMGSIFALCTAIQTKAFEKVILVSPSHVPFEAAAKDRKTMLGHSCVMWKGKELPYVSPDFSKYKAGRYYRTDSTDYPVTGMRLAYQEAYQDKQKEEAAILPLEETGADILMIAGEMDESWPSAYSVKKLEERLKKAQYPKQYRTILFPKGSHLCGMKPDEEENRILYKLIPAIGIMYRTFSKYRKENLSYMEQADCEIIQWTKE